MLYDHLVEEFLMGELFIDGHPTGWVHTSVAFPHCLLLLCRHTGLQTVNAGLLFFFFFSSEPKKRQCKVLFEYQPQNEDELELKVGDIVEITEEVL